MPVVPRCRRSLRASHMRDRFHVISNLLIFQVSYFACVLGGAAGLPWLGPGAVLGAVAWHLWRVGDRLTEARLLVVVLIIGTLFESAVTATGWVDYPSGWVVPWLAPVWILALWLLFATTLNLCLAWLKHRWWLAVVLGGAGGPLSFYGGSRLQAVELVDPVAVLVTLAVAWALLMPTVMWLSTRLDGWQRPLPGGTCRGADVQRVPAGH